MSGSTPRAGHTKPGYALIVLGFVLPGVIFFGLAAVSDLAPAFASRASAIRIDSGLERALSYGVGAALAAVGIGLLRGGRWAWYAAVVWAVVSVVELARGLWPDPRFSTVSVFGLAAVACGSYLWRHRWRIGPGSGETR